MCLKRWWGKIKGRTISLNREYCRVILAPRGTERLHRTLHILSPGLAIMEQPSWKGRLNPFTSTHTTRVSLLNALTFCSAVNNSYPWAVGGIRFRQKGRTPMSSSLNIHCLPFAGTMCGSDCKLKWSCVRWHLWIQNYHCGYLWGGGGGRLHEEKSGFLNLVPFLNWNTCHFEGRAGSPVTERVTGVLIIY